MSISNLLSSTCDALVNSGLLFVKFISSLPANSFSIKLLDLSSQCGKCYLESYEESTFSKHSPKEVRLKSLAVSAI